MGEENRSNQSTSFVSDAEMAQIPKSFVFEGMILPVQVFVRLKTNTYLTIAKKGERAQLESFKNFRHDNFQIFVKSDEKHIITGFIEDLSRRAIENVQIGLDKKSQFVSGLLSEAYTELEANGFSNLTRIKSVSNLVVKICKQAGNLNQVMEILNSQKASDAKHGMMTAMVSMMIAEEAGQLSPLNQDKLVLGALLHDIGLRTLPKTLREKPRHLWNADELKQYQQHPIQGAEILRYVDGMSVEVLLIISEHHELSNGNGYPKKLRDVRINPMSRIVGLADQFCDLISNNEGQTYTSEQALDYIENVLGQPYNKGLFSALKSIVNVETLNRKINKAAS